MKAFSVMIVALLLAGCESVSTGWRRKLESPLGIERAEGVMMIGRSGDAAGLPRLIDALEDNDVSVRVLAAETLRDMSGRRFDYCAYAAERERRPAVRRWRQWWEAEGKSLLPSKTEAGGSS